MTWWNILCVVIIFLALILPSAAELRAKAEVKRLAAENEKLKEENRVLRMIYAADLESREKMHRHLNGLRDSIVEYRKLLGLKRGEPRPAAPKQEGTPS